MARCGKTRQREPFGNNPFARRTGCELDGGRTREQTAARFLHHKRHVEQMIEVPVGDEDCVNVRPDVFQSHRDSCTIRLNRALKCHVGN